jgi:hypothetical protein
LLPEGLLLRFGDLLAGFGLFLGLLAGDFLAVRFGLLDRLFFAGISGALVFV